MSKSKYARTLSVCSKCNKPYSFTRKSEHQLTGICRSCWEKELNEEEVKNTINEEEP